MISTRASSDAILVDFIARVMINQTHRCCDSSGRIHRHLFNFDPPLETRQPQPRGGVIAASANTKAKGSGRAVGAFCVPRMSYESLGTNGTQGSALLDPCHWFSRFPILRVTLRHLVLAETLRGRRVGKFLATKVKQGTKKEFSLPACFRSDTTILPRCSKK